MLDDSHSDELPVPSWLEIPNCHHWSTQWDLHARSVSSTPGLVRRKAATTVPLVVRSVDRYKPLLLDGFHPSKSSSASQNGYGVQHWRQRSEMVTPANNIERWPGTLRGGVEDLQEERKKPPRNSTRPLETTTTSDGSKHGPGNVPLYHRDERKVRSAQL